MKTIYNTLRTFTCILCLTGMLAACTEGNEWETNPAKAALFRVHNVKVDKAAAQTASVSWSATSNAEYYIIEVSTEKLSDATEKGAAQNSIVYGEDKSITAIPALINGLTKSSTYYLRIKSFGNGLESGWAYLDGTFETTEEDILSKEFAEGDISAESIRVKWNDAGLPVTHLLYEWQVSNGEDHTTQEAVYELSAEEISAQSAVISGLLPGTKYNISIYNNDDLRGITEATTEQILAMPEVLGGNVTLKWNANGIAVTKLSYCPNNVEGAESIEQKLTEAEIKAGSTTLVGLDLGKEYTFMIYNGASLRGIATATTEQIMSIADSDIRGKSVTVTWADNGTAATKLTYLPTNGAEIVWSDKLSAEGTNVTGLEGETEYTFRIYTNDVLRGEQTVKTLKGLIDVTIEADITSATFTWEADETVVSYSCTASGATDNKVNLTSGEISSGQVTINGLTASTAYTFTLYNSNGNAVSNAQPFTTKEDPLAGYTVIELTTSSTKDDFTNAINNNTGNVAILISEGANIDGTGISIIPANITSLLIWGSDRAYTISENKPNLKVKDWIVYGDKNKIEFFNLNLTAGATTGFILQLGQSATSTEIGNINEIQFNSCQISQIASCFTFRKNTVTDKYCNSISFNDCLISEIGNYGLVFAGESGSGYRFNTISISNTTVHNVNRNIIYSNQTATFKLDINSCTFYKCGNIQVETNRYWISAPQNIDISVSNSLFTNLNIRTSPDGICNTLKETCNKTDIFYTNDCTGDNYANYWSTKLDYSSTDLFENPSEGNFKVKVSGYESYGDPRWNKQ